MFFFSAKPSTKKESYLHSFQVCCILYYKMAKWLQNVNMTILKSVTCLGFSNIEEFYQSGHIGQLMTKLHNFDVNSKSYERPVFLGPS